MKKLFQKRLIYKIVSLLIGLTVTFCNGIEASPSDATVQEAAEIPQEKILSFHYDNEELVDVINYVAAQKEVNVVFPIQPIEAKVTLHIDGFILGENVFFLKQSMRLLLLGQAIC